MTVAVLMDIPVHHRFHRATVAALEHAAEFLRIPVDVRVVPTDTVDDPAQVAATGSAVVIGPSTPYRDPDAAHAVVREARERNTPLVGT